MNKKFLFVLPVAFLLSAAEASAATATFIRNTRIVEDALWAVAFVLMSMFAYVAAKAMQGSVGIRAAYTLLLISGLFGFGWKLIGVIMRPFGLTEPEWFFEVTRESLETLASLFFAAAFIMLFLKLKKTS